MINVSVQVLTHFKIKDSVQVFTIRTPVHSTKLKDKEERHDEPNDLQARMDP